MAVPEKDELELSPWQEGTPLSRILAIRLQAHGDILAAMPYLKGLSESLPGVELDFLTRTEFVNIPKQLNLFRKVIPMPGRRNDLAQRLGAVLTGVFRMGKYDAVIDLQRNHISRWLRRKSGAKAWTEVDRFERKPAGERYGDAVRLLGVSSGEPSWLDVSDAPVPLLEQAGWNGTDSLVVLNPAGYWPTRNWPVENYVAFARKWLAERDPDTRFLLLGIERMAESAQAIRDALGDRCINLVGKTSPWEALTALSRAELVLGEDSGLLHMAWIQNLPCLTLFGSTHSVWARPVNPRSFSFTSEDLPCACCMKPECERGDLHCLVRRTPEEVFEKACELGGDS